jgi:hypothetical protein
MLSETPVTEWDRLRLRACCIPCHRRLQRAEMKEGLSSLTLTAATLKHHRLTIFATLTGRNVEALRIAHYRLRATKIVITQGIFQYHVVTHAAQCAQGIAIEG